MLLTREQILEAQDRRFVLVDIPEWGGTVRLMSLSADEALAQEALAKRRASGDTKVNPLTSMLAVSIVDADGKTMFRPSDLAALGQKSPAVLVKLIDAVKELNRLEATPEGNSEANQADD